MESKVTDEKHTQQRTNRRSYYCIARWCNNHNSNNVAMFRLPKGPRGKEWLRNAEREDLLNLEEAKLHRKYMCSKHFTQECFLKSNLLTWNAVPTLFTTLRNYAVSEKSIKTSNIPLASKQSLTNQNDHTRKNTTLLKPRGLQDASATTINVSRILKPRRSQDASATTINISRILKPRRSQDASATTKNVSRNGNEDNKFINSVTKSSLKTLNSHGITDFSKQTVQNSSCQTNLVCQTQAKKSPNFDSTELNESDQMVFLEEFPLMNQEPVLSCGTCGEIFLVESGLNQHRLRYHSETVN